MQLLRIDHLMVSYISRIIFQDLDFSVQEGDRIGLVGPNGAGKSTLFKAIIGEIEIDSGTIMLGRDMTLGYLPQDIELSADKTLYETATELPEELAHIDHALTSIDEQLSDPDVYNDEEKLTRVLNRQQKLLEEFDDRGGAVFISNVKSILDHLGLGDAYYDLPAKTLSGGQKKLVYLARLMASQPSILLLDEPDNHLDVPAKRRLESLLRAFSGAVVIISHDRYLLDEVANTIAELEGGTVTFYKGNYSAYKTERELQRLRQQQLYVAQQKEIARIEAAIKRFELWASMVVNERHIKQARSRRKMLDRMEERGEIIEKVTERRLMDLQLTGGRGSKLAIQLKNVAMGFNDDLLFVDLNFTVRHGERIGLVGPNGVGKSVIFKLIMGDLEPFEGRVDIGPSTHVGYYSQEHQTLQAWLDRTPLELVRDLKPMSEGQAVAFLLSFVFTYEQIRQPINVFSGGERSRLQLACMMLQKPNLLLLDEPTNNLDIASVEVLEQQLDSFEGAVLVISHDRYFLDNVVDYVVELDDGDLTRYEGGYTDYIDTKQRQQKKRRN